MARRLILQNELERLSNLKVYFQPPENLRMEYPCIVYELSGINTRQADNKKYLKFKRYSITVITRNPDDNLPEAILDHFDNCSFDRQFKTAGLYHNVLTLYY